MQPESFKLKKGEKAVFGNFIPDQDGHELALVSTSKQKLLWSIQGASGAVTSRFGSPDASPLACDVDGDGTADKAVANKVRFMARLSSTGKTVKIAFRRMGNVELASCADVNGDGIDEVVVVSAASGAADGTVLRGEKQLSILSVATRKPLEKFGAKAKKIIDVAAINLTDDTAPELCFAKPAGRGAATVTCRVDSGEIQIPVPAAITGLFAGNLPDSSGHLSEQLAVMLSDGSLATLAIDGTLTRLGSAAAASAGGRSKPVPCK